jgi:hypothetical protein
MKKKYLITGLALLLATFCLQAQQITLTTPAMLVETGDEILVPIKVSSFSGVYSLQFGLRWNPEILEFDTVQDFNLPEMNVGDNFNLNNAPDGKARVIWFQFDPNSNGVTLSDGESIFSMGFKVVGEGNVSTALEVYSDTMLPPLEVRIEDGNGMPFVTNIETGTITVNGPNAAHETKTEAFTLFQNSPNPFSDETFISFNLNETTDAVLSIYDNTGKTIFRQDGKFNRGMHRIPVQRNLFSSAGSYYYSLETEKSKATRKLIAQ